MILGIFNLNGKTVLVSNKGIDKSYAQALAEADASN